MAKGLIAEQDPDGTWAVVEDGRSIVTGELTLTDALYTLRSMRSHDKIKVVEKDGYHYTMRLRASRRDRDA